MLRKIAAPALISLSLLGASLAPAAFAQKPTPAPGKSDKMGSSKMGSKKKTPERGADGRFKKKATPAPAKSKMGTTKMGTAKMGKSMGAPAGKPTWDAKIKRWRLNGKFISEAEALKLGGKK